MFSYVNISDVKVRVIIRKHFCKYSRHISVMINLYMYYFYRVFSKVLIYPYNSRRQIATLMNMISRYSKVTMRYEMKPTAAPPAVKCEASAPFSKAMHDTGKRSINKL